ncbi:TPA: DUF1127 domain-containing protein [Vibrio vulnificus]|uniref:DUF1127 domain-containing protein n=1 Tax=Vibrio vulnificus TaxID=672 RepID=A0ABX4WV02_VIBVL|nr:DUF1127 domain-containing protein [Vibrio vulnificus]EGQ9936129.1 DUF1127 domain-containing protein [Vibrio vulnificus]EGR0052214.1 DUF1127 domain-containing protein [Vibrio vulnificus]EID4339247.1 DUF1127 domain-containing protein [Vibrio vulnificus]EID4374381.1 DUF1127 domain-containing protein [Vibrio vulnificus]MCU8117729.1 DUF1127 domain-containing protein [Vibrio vulnificus]
MESNINHHSLTQTSELTLIKKLLNVLGRWRRNHSTRAHLSNLSDHLYKDVGLTKEQVRDEVKRSYWD